VSTRLSAPALAGRAQAGKQAAWHRLWLALSGKRLRRWGARLCVPAVSRVPAQVVTAARAGLAERLRARRLARLAEECLRAAAQ